MSEKFQSLWSKAGDKIKQELKNSNAIIDVTQSAESLILSLLFKENLPKNKLECLYTPGTSTIPSRYEALSQLMGKLGYELRTIPIKFLESAAKNAYMQTYKRNLTQTEELENNLRNAVTQTLSVEQKVYHLNTLDVFQELEKEELTKFALFINKTHDNIIPTNLLE